MLAAACFMVRVCNAFISVQVHTRSGGVGCCATPALDDSPKRGEYQVGCLVILPWATSALLAGEDSGAAAGWAPCRQGTPTTDHRALRLVWAKRSHGRSPGMTPHGLPASSFRCAVAQQYAPEDLCHTAACMTCQDHAHTMGAALQCMSCKR